MRFIIRKEAAGAALLILSSFAPACGKGSDEPVVSGALKAHTAEFEKKVYKVTEGVHVAVGFGLANSILIEGEDGAIIVDTMESIEEARSVRAEFEKITKKPVRALVFTHNHTDHVFGSRAWADSRPDVYAHETTDAYIDRIASVFRPITGTRAMRMFGNLLDQEGLENAGIGPRLAINDESTLGILRPNKTFRDELETTVAGVKIKLVHAPGETNDQLFVWLPEKKVLLPGDNFYRAFPNLYTIRGTPFRSLDDWVTSLDKMRAHKPEFLVPSHTRPIAGAAKIEDALRDYRDAIQYVHDQAVRGINMGRTPDDLVAAVALPPHLAASPYLQPFYGKVSWSLRSMFSGHLGWFDGNSSQLQPLPPRAEAELMERLAGGRGPLVEQAEEELENKNYQAALRLTDFILRLDPGDSTGKSVRIAALTALGRREENANARHYYLTEAIEVERGEPVRTEVKPDPATARSFPLSVYFKNLRVNLDPEASADVDTKVGFVFTDVPERYTVHVRRGVAAVSPVLEDGLDIEVRLDSNAWKEMLARLRNPATTAAGFRYEKGGTLKFLNFLRLFRPAEMKVPFALE